MKTETIDRAEAEDRANQILGLAAAFRAELGKAGQAAYLVALADVPLPALKRAVAEALRMSRFMPSVSELRTFAGVQVGVESRAIIAFEVLSRAVSHEGSYRSVVFDDPILNATVASLGGWESICGTLTDEWESHFRHRFLKTYAANYESRRGTMYPQLGIADRANGPNGYEQREPRLIPTGLPTVPGITYERPKPLAALIGECAERIGLEKPESPVPMT